MASDACSVNEWITRYLNEERPRSKSLIVTVFGDSIAPHSQGIWLGNLIRLLEPFELSERLVRTSAYRLVEEGWLKTRREGRHSHYSLTPSGLRRFELAYGRIYTAPVETWDGSWTMVILPRIGDAIPERSEFRRELEWQGFASPVPGTMLRPAANLSALKQILRDVDLADRTIVLDARPLDNFSTESIDALIRQCWDLEGIRSDYDRFVERFQPIRDTLNDTRIGPQQALVVQTLLIHSFRRVILHDPRLPLDILPRDWPGLGAYRLCREIYRMTYQLAQSHIESTMGPIDNGASPAALSMPVRQRFGGLT